MKRVDLKEKYGVVYCITNTTNGKQYVGQTTSVRPIRRWRSHVLSSQNPVSTHPLCRAIRKHGFESFAFEVIANAFNQADLDQLEIEFIQNFQTITPYGYNLKEGGLNGKHSIEFRLRMSKFRSQPEQRLRQSKIQKVVQNRPDVKLKHRVGVIESWNRPGERERRGKIISEALNRPDIHFNRCRVMKLAQNSPKARKSRRLAYATPEVKARLGKTRNTFWVNNGIEHKRVWADSIPVGWSLGRIPFYTKAARKKISDFHGNSRWITNGTKNSRVLATSTLPVGWKYGQVRGAGIRVQF